MAAGLGFKTFTTGEVLTAADTNGYLMQGINVFATNAARDAAITAPAEGQFAFTKDTNSLWYYDGAAWVASGATGDIEGVTAGIGISGGGTSGTVTVTNSMATAIDAKGDLVAGTGADAFSRLAVGANDTVLTADSAQATGLKWATPVSGSLTLLASGTLTGASVNVTGISQSYKGLRVLVYNWRPNLGGNNLEVRFNNDSNSRYISASPALFNAAAAFTQTEVLVLGHSGNTTTTTNFGMMEMWNYADTTSWKFAQTYYSNSDNTTSTSVRMGQGTTTYNQTTAVTSILFWADGGTFSAGNYYIYGVN